MQKYKNPVVKRNFFGPRQVEMLSRHLLTGKASDVIEYQPDDSVHQSYRDIPFEDDDFEWAYQKMRDVVYPVNDREWGFDITDFRQPLRVARYRPGQKFDWHVDYTPEDDSKIAVSIALNDTFIGGRLEVLEAKTPGFLNPGQGVLFPAFLGHRITSVTSGERLVLLAWFTGPRFR